MRIPTIWNFRHYSIFLVLLYLLRMRSKPQAVVVRSQPFERMVIPLHSTPCRDKRSSFRFCRIGQLESMQANNTDRQQDARLLPSWSLRRERCVMLCCAVTTLLLDIPVDSPLCSIGKVGRPLCCGMKQRPKISVN